jgi:alpha-galactosidase
MIHWDAKKVTDIRIAYIGGGSRGWAWGLMSDLAVTEDICGTVALYDIDKEAANKNQVIGNRIGDLPDCRSPWKYEMADTLPEALTGADFVVISITPGTFDEMESDVHTPEKYGIYQSVGDTAGPGGLVRALRCLPMFEEFAQGIKAYCPNAWVINYTNPMSVCVRTLYKVFPQIKAFGCCHEVFATQKLLGNMLEEMKGIKDTNREDIHIEVTGVNHFTWLTKAQYRDLDLFPIYREFALKYQNSGRSESADENWLNRFFLCKEKVKFDLFLRFGAIAAAGDRHLAEFCPGSWYLKDPDTVESWGFALTPVSWRKEHLKELLDKSNRIFQQQEAFELQQTGEEGVQQIRALLGLRDLVTNVNIPNRGQIPNLPLGAVVETNAHFCANTVTPLLAGVLPDTIYPLVSRVCGEQELIVQAVRTRNLDLAFQAFCMDPNMNLPLSQGKELFHIMLENTKSYLSSYPLFES